MTITETLRALAERGGMDPDEALESSAFVDVAHAAIARAALADARRSLRDSEPRLAAIVRASRRAEVRP